MPDAAPVGLISDTHGLLREEATEALRGCSLIIHAGDVGDRAILARLAAIAPVTAVRGNIDRGAWAQALPLCATVDTDGGSIYVLHDIGALEVNPAAEAISMVVYGHSHKPGQKVVEGVAYVNPGSAGPRRFKLPVTVARASWSGVRWEVTFVELSPTTR